MHTKTPFKPKVNLISLGCSKNTVDSEKILGQLNYHGVSATYQGQEDDYNTVIINTCGFIENAKQESIDAILAYADAKNKGEIEKLYVAGCLSERYRHELEAEIKEVDAFFGTYDLPLLLEKFNIDYREELIGERTLSTDTHYSYLKISDGCNRKCTFCSIPKFKGLHKSRTIESLVEEATFLAKKGTKELMLIAQELTYYGLDIYKKRALKELIDKLSEIEEIKWIRLHYAYPAQFPESLIEIIRDNPKVCKYLDIPLQHASDKVLKDMKRNIDQKTTRNLIAKLREEIPNIAIRTTMLTGFPTETGDDFQDLISFVEDMKFDRLGVFAYSHEDGTEAFKYEDIWSQDEKNRRVNELMEVQGRISYTLNQEKIGKTFKVLIDRIEGKEFVGRTEFDSPEVDNEVRFTSEKALKPGDFCHVEILDAFEFDLIGREI
ncbi:MAG: 30S ribosomal protein S12 methylthiotransferase RimO [Chitinophagales bacterium]|nr:30S ribosomal protein S12 methylthiotransferase RimO [Chitinophagales bacterium]